MFVGFTTAAAFLLMLVASFAGSRSLGAIAGVGVVMSITSMLVVFPVLLLWADRRASARGEALPNVSFDWLRRVGAFSVRHAHSVAAVFLAVSVFLAFQLQFVTLQQDALALEPHGLDAIERQQRILDEMGESTDLTAFIVDDWAEVEGVVGQLSESVTFDHTLSLLDVMPSNQEALRGPLALLHERVERFADGLSAEAPPPYSTERLDELSERLLELKVMLVKLSMGARLFYGPEVQDALGTLRDTVNTVARRVDAADTSRLEYLE